MKTLTKADFKFDGDSAEISPGLSVRVKVERDECHSAPWEECDGHGPVTDWERRDKRAGERILCTDRSAKRFYDFAEAMAIAKRDGWGISDERKATLARGLGREPTAGEIRASAVEHDFKFLADWCADRWEYVVVTVTLLDAVEKEITCDSLGGVESCGEYWRECAAEMANTLAQAHEKEIAEREHWEARDVETVKEVKA